MNTSASIVDSYRRIVNAGTIEAYLKTFHNRDISVALLAVRISKTAHERELENFIVRLRHWSDFSPLLVCDEGTFFIFLRDTPLHQGTQKAQAFLKETAQELPLEFECAAMTLVDQKDDTFSLKSRIQRYLHLARTKSKKRFCYGTLRHDFCTQGDEENLLLDFFSRYRKLSLHNFIEGIPFCEEAEILTYRDGFLRLKTSLAAAVLLKNEPFTFLRHPLLPDTLKADIANTFAQKTEIIVHNLRFVDDSPLDRKNVRVIPPTKLDAFIDCEESAQIPCKVEALAVDSISLEPADAAFAHRCNIDAKKHAVVHLQLPTRNGNNHFVAVPAFFNGRTHERLIFFIYPTPESRKKIEDFIALQKERLTTRLQKIVLDFYRG